MCGKTRPPGRDVSGGTVWVTVFGCFITALSGRRFEAKVLYGGGGRCLITPFHHSNINIIFYAFRVAIVTAGDCLEGVHLSRWLDCNMSRKHIWEGLFFFLTSAKNKWHGRRKRMILSGWRSRSSAKTTKGIWSFWNMVRLLKHTLWFLTFSVKLGKIVISKN